MPHLCDCCGDHRLTLRSVFVNGKGWQRLCPHCPEPANGGAPKAYRGPNPITTNILPGHALCAVIGGGDAAK